MKIGHFSLLHTSDGLPTSDVEELDLDVALGGYSDTTKVSWWKKRFPNRKLVVRQPVCRVFLPSPRRHFVAIPQTPLVRIEHPPNESVIATDQSLENQLDTGAVNLAEK